MILAVKWLVDAGMQQHSRAKMILSRFCAVGRYSEFFRNRKKPRENYFRNKIKMNRLLTLLFISFLSTILPCLCADSSQTLEDKKEGKLTIEKEEKDVGVITLSSKGEEEGRDLKKKRRKRKKVTKEETTPKLTSFDSSEPMPVSGPDSSPKDHSGLIKALEAIVANHAQLASVDSLLIENAELERRLNELKSQRHKEKQEFGENFSKLKSELERTKKELEKKHTEQVTIFEAHAKEVGKLKQLLKDRDGVVAILNAEKEKLEVSRQELLKEKQSLLSAVLASSSALAVNKIEIEILQARLIQHEKLQPPFDVQELSIKELQAERDEYSRKATQAQQQIMEVKAAFSKLQLAGPQQVIEIPNGPFGVHYYTVEEAKEIIRRTEFKEGLGDSTHS